MGERPSTMRERARTMQLRLSVLHSTLLVRFDTENAEGSPSDCAPHKRKRGYQNAELELAIPKLERPTTLAIVGRLERTIARSRGSAMIRRIQKGSKMQILKLNF
jgi:hypothetical protein